MQSHPLQEFSKQTTFLADDASSAARLEADALSLALPTLLACVLPSDKTRLTMTRRAATTFAKLGENKERDSEGGRRCNKPTLQSKDRGGGDPRQFPTNVFANPRTAHTKASQLFFFFFPFNDSHKLQKLRLCTGTKRDFFFCVGGGGVRKRKLEKGSWEGDCQKREAEKWEGGSGEGRWKRRGSRRCRASLESMPRRRSRIACVVFDSNRATMFRIGGKIRRKKGKGVVAVSFEV